MNRGELLMAYDCWRSQHPTAAMNEAFIAGWMAALHLDVVGGSAAPNSAMVPCLAYKDRFKVCDHAVVFCNDKSDSCVNKAQHQ